MQPASGSETLAAWRRGEGSLLALLYSYFLASAAGAVEVAPGEEFRVALIAAKQVGSLSTTISASAGHARAASPAVEEAAVLNSFVKVLLSAVALHV